MKTTIGEGICLTHDDDVSEWHVRGHVSGDVAEAWATECAIADDLAPSRYFVVRHQWARWSLEGTPASRVLRTYWDSGPGRFPITTAFDGDEWERLRRIRVRRRAETARAREAMAAMWPEAEVETVHVQAEGLPTLASLRFPWSRHGTVRMRVDGTHIVVPYGDLDAWEAYKEGPQQRPDSCRPPPSLSKAQD